VIPPIDVPIASTALGPAVMAPSWHAAHAPDRPAIVMGSSGVVVTYAQLDERSRKFAAALHSRGLNIGDHIAILLGNSHAFLEVAWAAQRAGLYYTPINNHLRPGEVQYVLDDCGASALVSSQALADVIERLDSSRIPVRISSDGNLAGFEHYDDVLATQSAAPLDDECEGREMLYSSGTTGRPKGIRKPLPGTMFGDPSSVVAQIASGLTAGCSDGDAVYLCPAPLYHSAPLRSLCRRCSSACSGCLARSVRATTFRAYAGSCTPPPRARSR
jgi:long-chain acyl-CoA synthetase